MNWQEICDTRVLHDIPFKIETNRWGKIEMSPASNEHGLYQSLLIKWLFQLSNQGCPISECSVQTRQGVKVADVAWGGYDFFKKNKRLNPYLQSPEIMIEIISPSNTQMEMDEKGQLYFAQDAKEFWLCDHNGIMSFFDADKKLSQSTLIPNFPMQISIDFA